MMKTHCTVPAGWASRLSGSFGFWSKNLQRQQKDVLARIVSFEPINFHLDKEAPCSVMLGSAEKDEDHCAKGIEVF